MSARIGITGMSAEKYSSPGIHVARCIKEDRPDISLVALGEPLMPGMYMRDILDAAYVVLPGDIHKIIEICKAHDIDGLIPNTDSDVELCAEHRTLFDEENIALIIPPLPAVQIANDKLKTSGFADSLGIRSSETIESTTDRLNQIPAPYVLKGSRGGVLVAHTNGEGAVADQYLRQMGEIPIIQKLVDGEPYSTAGIAVDGEIRAAVSIKKLNITETGSTLTGVTIQDEHLRNIADRIISETNWSGPFEIEFIKNSHYYLIEINCRFPAWIYLSKGAGLNLPAMLADMLFGERKEADKGYKYKTGVAFMRLPVDQILDIDEIVGLEMREKVEW